MDESDLLSEVETPLSASAINLNSKQLPADDSAHSPEMQVLNNPNKKEPSASIVTINCVEMPHSHSIIPSDNGINSEICDTSETILLKAVGEKSKPITNNICDDRTIIDPDVGPLHRSQYIQNSSSSECDRSQNLVNNCSTTNPLTPTTIRRKSSSADSLNESFLASGASRLLSPPETPLTPQLPLLATSSDALATSTPLRGRLSSTPCGGLHAGHRTLPATLGRPSTGAAYSAAAADTPTASTRDGPMSLPVVNSNSKSYDYLLKVLLVGDSDVGKQEIIRGMEDGSLDSPYCSSAGAAYKTTIILIDGKKVKLHIWDTSGQGRFCTIIRSYSRGAQGILLVYDITNRWSFEGIDRWVREVEEHAPGIPKVLVGNRLHLAFKRQVECVEAEMYAERHNMGFYEISPLVNFNITESFQELCRMALKRNGMERLWRANRVLSLHELCAHAIVGRTSGYGGIDRLPLPDAIKANLKSYALTSSSMLSSSLHPHHNLPHHHTSASNGGIIVNGRQHYKTLKERKKRIRPAGGAGSTAVAAANTDTNNSSSSGSNCANVSRKSCVIS